MYQAPKLVRYGTFRELTLQNPGTSCPTVPLVQKIDPSLDAAFGPGQTNDGCPQFARKQGLGL
jgi:hypothetical protein